MALGRRAEREGVGVGEQLLALELGRGTREGFRKESQPRRGGMVGGDVFSVNLLPSN